MKTSLLALAFSLVTLVPLAVVPLARRRAEAVTPEAPAPAAGPSAPAVPSSAASTPGMSGSDAASIAAEIVAKREREIVDRIWPKIVRMREGSGLSVPAKPTKLDDALVYLLDMGDDEEAADGRPPELKKQSTQCKNDLKQLGIYFCLYEARFRVYPAAIEDVRRPDMMTADSTILNCPFDASGDPCSYEYVYPIRGDEEPPDMIMAYDKRLHPDGKRCVLYFQGRVDEVADGEFQKMLGEQVAKDRADLGDEVVKARTLALDPALTGPQKDAALKRLNTLESLSR